MCCIEYKLVKSRILLSIVDLPASKTCKSAGCWMLHERVFNTRLPLGFQNNLIAFLKCRAFKWNHAGECLIRGWCFIVCLAFFLFQWIYCFLVVLPIFTSYHESCLSYLEVLRCFCTLTLHNCCAAEVRTKLYLCANTPLYSNNNDNDANCYASFYDFEYTHEVFSCRFI